MTLFRSLGLTLKRHPIEILEESGALGAYTHAENLTRLPHKSLVTVAGVVTGRQSPGTAAGVTFITLEDHTGNSNIVVWLATARAQQQRSEEHTSELQSRGHLVCRLLLEKKNQVKKTHFYRSYRYS